jgi:hypothetical protein
MFQPPEGGPAPPEWQPTGEVERDLMAALEDEDGGWYARVVMSAPLYVPALPEHATEGWQELEERLSLEQEHVLAFTSPAALSQVLGRFAGSYVETGFAELVENWPNPSYLLPIDVLADLAEGRESLVAVEDVQAVVRDEMHAQIRQLCLERLGNAPVPGGQDAPPNELEAKLSDAVARQDGDAFLQALIGADVVVPTSRPALDPHQFDDRDFPWLAAGDTGLSVLMVFSSTSTLERVAVGDQPRVQVPFLAVLANWPSEEHILCFNLSAETELILPGDSVMELVAAVAESLAVDDEVGQ